MSNRFDFNDSDCYGTDIGPICPNAKCQSTIWLYQLNRFHNGNLVVGECFGCHCTTNAFPVSQDPTIQEIKEAHFKLNRISQ